jgi:HAE1 family hydrophobic/amphiphilic exporter-1
MSAQRREWLLSEFITLNKVYGPSNINRFNLFTSINVNAAAASGYSSGDVSRLLKEVAFKTLPEGYGYDFLV